MLKAQNYVVLRNLNSQKKPDRNQEDKGDVVRTVKLPCVIVIRWSHHFMSLAGSPSCISCKPPPPQTATTANCGSACHCRTDTPFSCKCRGALRSLAILGEAQKIFERKRFRRKCVGCLGRCCCTAGGGRCAPTGGEIFGATPCIAATFASAAWGFGGLGRGGVLDLTETVRILTRGRVG